MFEVGDVVRYRAELYYREGLYQDNWHICQIIAFSDGSTSNRNSPYAITPYAILISGHRGWKITCSCIELQKVADEEAMLWKLENL